MSKTDVPNTGIKDVQDWASNIFKQQGNTAHNPILGDIGLTLKSVKDSIAHGKSQFKFAVFPAIKTVLEQGVLIDTRQIDGVGYHLTKPSKAKENLEKMRVQLNSVLTIISDNELVLTYPDGELSNIKNKLLLALENVPEMVAYGMTDPDVQKFIGIYLDLDKAQVTGVKRLKTILDNFFGAVYSLLGLQKKLSFKTFVANADSLVHEIDFNQIGKTRQSTKSNWVFEEVSHKATSIAEARAFVETFKGKLLVNQATGLQAKVSRNSLDKMLSQSAMRKSVNNIIHLTAVANVDSLFAKAIKGWDKVDRAGDTDIERISRFFAPMVVDGQAYLVKLTVKEFANDKDGNRIYSVEGLDVSQKESLVADMVAADFTESELTSNRPHKAVDSLLQAIQDYNNHYQTRYNKQTIHDKASNTVNQTPTLTLLKGLDSFGVSDEHNAHLDGLIDGLLASYYVYHSPSQRVDVSQGKLKNKAD